MVECVLGEKIGRVMADASLVVCGNEYICDYADALRLRAIIIPTFVDADIYHPAGSQVDGVLVIGGIGSLTTSVFLKPIAPLLRRMVEEGLAQVRIVGAAADMRLEWRFVCVD